MALPSARTVRRARSVVNGAGMVRGVWCTFAYRRSDTCENFFTIVADVVNRSRLGVLHSCTLAVVAAHHVAARCRHGAALLGVWYAVCHVGVGPHALCSAAHAL